MKSNYVLKVEDAKAVDIQKALQAAGIKVTSIIEVHKEHYFSAIGVASVFILDSLSAGDLVHIKGHTTDFDQTIDSIQINKKEVPSAEKGENAGIKVRDYVRKNDLIYRIEN
jgi:putative protease